MIEKVYCQNCKYRRSIFCVHKNSVYKEETPLMQIVDYNTYCVMNYKNDCKYFEKRDFFEKILEFFS